MLRSSLICALLVSLPLLLLATAVRADVDARALRMALGKVGRPLQSGNRVVALVEHDHPVPASIPGLIPVSDRFSGLRVQPEQFDAAAAQLSGARLLWSPPRRLLMDRMGQWTRLENVHEAGTGTGRGVVVGIVDTGVDLAHPDLRNPDGTTRVAWLLDFSRQPLGLQPELEEEYACSDEPGFECQVLSAADINQMLTSIDIGQLPSDEIGHGTHVASLAAGNGLANAPARYVGAAPEATLVVVRVTRQTAAVDDFDILLGTDFVFQRARELSMPAVVNLSLGSDFGPHDGTDGVGRALREFLDVPGRAIVVAAGNSGTLYSAQAGQYQGPFGIHTDVFVPSGDGVRVPLLTPTPPNDAASVEATLFVWIGFEPGSDLRVGLDTLDGPWIPPIGRGEIESVDDEGLEVTLLNNYHSDDSPLSSATDGAVVLFDGEWAAGRTFVLRFEGEGAANLWVQSEGDLGPGAGSVGALFPRATATHTINIPAVNDDLIAVGATVNRDRWPNRVGDVSRVRGAFAPLAEPDVVAWFSSAGPQVGGSMKPDLLAPGAFVVGAMSLRADPDISPFSLFADISACEVADCSVVDDFHAVTTGTSMAAPIVAGAAALLFEQDPELTHAQVRSLLQASARKLTTAVVPQSDVRAGAGVLDAVSALQALAALSSDERSTADADTSHLLLAASVLHPSAASRIQGLIQLRDADDLVAANVDEDRLQLQLSGAQLSRRINARAPGLYDFEIAGVPGQGASEATVTVLLDGRPFLSAGLVVAVDSSAASEGHTASGGCALAAHGGPQQPWLAWLAVIVALGLRRHSVAKQPKLVN
ncbi:MAG TPA: S8 family serine peptidase [Polyangiaceae bacterium]|nr:S8 family serine peptidase [Polyangiaceae bacterium]